MLSFKTSLALVLLMIFSCTSQKKAAVKTIEPKLTHFLSFEKKYASGLLLTDSTIIVTNPKQFNNDYFFYEYGIDTKNLVNKYIANGTGKGMALSGHSFGINNEGDMYIKDMRMAKLITIPLSGKGSAVTQKSTEFPVKDLPFSLVGLDDHTVLKISSLFDSSVALFQKVDLAQNKVLANYGKMLPTPENTPFSSWKHANVGYIFVQPNQQHAAFAYWFSDRLVISNLVNKQEKNNFSEKNIPIEFTPVQAGDIKLSAHNDKTRYAYTKGYATDQYLYLLFSGRKVTDANDYLFGNTIHVYDWDCNLMYKIKTNKDISCLAVSKDDKKLYVFDPKNEEVLVSDIQF